jgi:hypothetical protein
LHVASVGAGVSDVDVERDLDGIFWFTLIYIGSLNDSIVFLNVL